MKSSVHLFQDIRMDSNSFNACSLGVYLVKESNNPLCNRASLALSPASPINLSLKKENSWAAFSSWSLLSAVWSNSKNESKISAYISSVIIDTFFTASSPIAIHSFLSIWYKTWLDICWNILIGITWDIFLLCLLFLLLVITRNNSNNLYWMSMIS